MLTLSNISTKMVQLPACLPPPPEAVLIVSWMNENPRPYRPEFLQNFNLAGVQLTCHFGEMFERLQLTWAEGGLPRTKAYGLMDNDYFRSTWQW